MFFLVNIHSYCDISPFLLRTLTKKWHSISFLFDIQLQVLNSPESLCSYFALHNAPHIFIYVLHNAPTFLELGLYVPNLDFLPVKLRLILHALVCISSAFKDIDNLSMLSCVYKDYHHLHAIHTLIKKNWRYPC